MNLRWNLHRKEKDLSNPQSDEVNSEHIVKDSTDRVNTEGFLEREMRAMMHDEIKGAAQDLVEAQRKEIRLIVEACKQVIAEVLEDEKKAINDKKETIRKLVVSLNQNQM